MGTKERNKGGGGHQDKDATMNTQVSLWSKSTFVNVVMRSTEVDLKEAEEVYDEFMVQFMDQIVLSHKNFSREQFN